MQKILLDLEEKLLESWKDLDLKLITSFKNNNIYNNKILKKYLIFFAKQKGDEFKNSKYSDFEFKVSGEIFWKKNLIAKLFKNTEITNPKIKVFFDDFFSDYKKEIELKSENVLSIFFK